jgi:hypothetical protein
MGGLDPSLLADFARVRVDFWKIDLQIALTFSGIALETADLAKKQRTTRTLAVRKMGLLDSCIKHL